MTLLAASVVVCLFFFCWSLFGIVAQSKEALGILQVSMAVLQDPNREEIEKEEQIKKASLQLAYKSFTISLGLFVSLLLPIGFILLGDYLGILDSQRVFAMLFEPLFVSASLLLMVLYSRLSLIRTRQ